MQQTGPPVHRAAVALCRLRPARGRQHDDLDLRRHAVTARAELLVQRAQRSEGHHATVEWFVEGGEWRADLLKRACTLHHRMRDNHRRPPSARRLSARVWYAAAMVGEL